MIVAVIVIILYFVGALQLFRFASNIRSLIRTGDEAHLLEAFRYFRNHYRYMGIIMVALTALTVIGIIIGSLENL